MKKMLGILCFLMHCSGSFCQNVMNIYQCDGTISHLPTACIDSITYSTYNLPTLNTANITGLNLNTAVCGGTVTSDGGTPVTARGVCWDTSPNPVFTGNHTTNGTGLGSFTSYLNGLNGNTIYYVRAYATNLIGTSYGNTVSFTTTSTGPGVIDVDGNFYNTIVIGSQEWMQENLKTTHYRNGQTILEVEDSATWAGIAYPSNAAMWCSVDGDSMNNFQYGKLYNWYVATSPNQVCPVGWHVPVDSEWTQLINYLGGATIAGKHLKATTPNWWGGDNTSGFTALPAASRAPGGWYASLGYTGTFWSATDQQPFPTNSDQPGIAGLFYQYMSVTSNGASKYAGNSIRCLKD